VQARELLEPLHGRLLGHGRLEPAGAEPEPKQLAHARAALAHEVDPGDPAIDDAVLHVLRHVGRADEQDVDRRVPARKCERPLAGHLGAEAGVLQKRDRRLAQPPLHRDRDRQAAVETPLRRSSASR
jgi:hypothetical protein